MNRKKWCAVFVAGCAAGLMVAICTSVWMERPGAAGGEVLILPLIGLLLYAIDWERYVENRKSSVRCKAEHAFRIIKCQFGYKKTVYRGLKKTENRLYAMFACANLYALAIAGRKLSTT